MATVPNHGSPSKILSRVVLLCRSSSQFQFTSSLTQSHPFVFVFYFSHICTCSFPLFSLHYMIIKLLSLLFLSALTLPLFSLPVTLRLPFSLQQSQGYFYPECHCSARAHTSLALAAALGCTLLHHTYLHKHKHTHTHTHACSHTVHINAKWRRPV